MNTIFSKLFVYAGKWELKDSRDFTDEEIHMVDEAIVVPSQYGNSVQFTMVNGGLTFIPLSNDSSCDIGDSIDLNKAKLLTLGKQGEEDIYRVQVL